MKEVEDLIKIRNKLSEIFQNSQKEWGKEKIHYLCVAMGNLDVAILNLSKFHAQLQS